ncbi:hypothetical protein [Halorubellus salinus]|uniref:hypothetical protein n=1 Tax=Halorubellus salinus TaxID=755309 RepID=UPI001D069552|nr:hypothetical protein [Halorubellus salinus]
MEVPDDAPEECPVCDRAYDSVSEHDAGVMVNLLDNERYQRVCFEPRSGGRLWFFHHTHAQTATARDAYSD